MSNVMYGICRSWNGKCGTVMDENYNFHTVHFWQLDIPKRHKQLFEDEKVVLLFDDNNEIVKVGVIVLSRYLGSITALEQAIHLGDIQAIELAREGLVKRFKDLAERRTAERHWLKLADRVDPYVLREFKPNTITSEELRWELQEGLDNNEEIMVLSRIPISGSNELADMIIKLEPTPRVISFARFLFSLSTLSGRNNSTSAKRSTPKQTREEVKSKLLTWFDLHGITHEKKGDSRLGAYKTLRILEQNARIEIAKRNPQAQLFLCAEILNTWYWLTENQRDLLFEDFLDYMEEFEKVELESLEWTPGLLPQALTLADSVKTWLSENTTFDLSEAEAQLAT